MASPAGDGALKPLQRAMKLANEAIKLDTGNRHREAYVKYLNNVSFISQFLAEEAKQKGGEFLNSDSHKMLKVADQCLERARTTAGKLGKADVELMTQKNRISEVPDPPATTDVSAPATTTPVPSRAPMGQPWGHRRSCSDEVQKHGGFPSPEVFQMLRAAEAQSSKKELTPLQEASIQNKKLRATYEARLSRLDPRQAAQKTSLTLSLQRQMMENLEIAKAREETLQRKAEERRVRLQEESDRRFKSERLTPAQEEQKRLYTAVLEYEQDHRWTWICKQKIKSNINDLGPVSNYVYQIFSIPEHPIARLVRRLQCQIYSRLYLIISKDPSRESSASDIGHRSLPVELVSLLAPGGPKLRSSQSLYCLPSCPPQPSIQHSLSISDELQSLEKSTDSRNDREKDIESSFEDLEHLLSPSSLSGPAALEKLSASQYLNTVVKEIHNARDLLVSSAVLSLDLPITPPVKEVCLECIDESFFPPLWPALLALYRQVLSTREESLLQIMELYRTAPPSVVGVSKRLYPEDVKDPYRSAAEDLEEMTNQHTPNKKLECIAKTLRGICECADEYCATPRGASIGADDLLPILAFVILRSGMSRLVSECAALEEFIYEGYLIGEEGYCLTSLQSALVYLETLPIPPSPPPI